LPASQRERPVTLPGVVPSGPNCLRAYIPFWHNDALIRKGAR